jgi:hypothetical protein
MLLGASMDIVFWLHVGMVKHFVVSNKFPDVVNYYEKLGKAQNYGTTLFCFIFFFFYTCDHFAWLDIFIEERDRETEIKGLGNIFKSSDCSHSPHHTQSCHITLTQSSRSLPNSSLRCEHMVCWRLLEQLVVKLLF